MHDNSDSQFVETCSKSWKVMLPPYLHDLDPMVSSTFDRVIFAVLYGVQMISLQPSKSSKYSRENLLYGVSHIAMYLRIRDVSKNTSLSTKLCDAMQAMRKDKK
uniref:Uncharacterized protein n=1 Tax=Megaselia scalaris TaxID=36166 RepID=T1GUM0_MEGSC